MAPQAPIRNLEGMAEPYDGERVDLRVSSEHLTSASEFNRQRELARLIKDADEAADQGVTAYAQEGIAEIETKLNGGDNLEAVVAPIMRVGDWLDYVRQDAVQQKSDFTLTS